MYDLTPTILFCFVQTFFKKKTKQNKTRKSLQIIIPKKSFLFLFCWGGEALNKKKNKIKYINGFC